MVRKMSDRICYDQGNFRSGKCFSGGMSSQESVLQGSTQSGNCPFEEMSVGKVTFGEVPGWEIVHLKKCPSGKRQSGICPRESVSRGTV